MRLVILGAAESGVGTAVLAQKQGYEVFVSDMGAIRDRYKSVLSERDIEWEEGQHTEQRILSADEVVKSPGIPDTAPMVQKLIAQDTPILSEIEFCSRYTKGRMLCITGSNGKTTTTSLIYYIMQNAGKNVGLGGNIGRSLALQIAEDDKDWYVVELSSFQLDNCFAFHPHIAVLLNITPDHLDRYEYDMQHYVDSKMRIIQNQTAEDEFIYWTGDEYVDKELRRRADGEHIPASTPSSRPAVEGQPTLRPFDDDDSRCPESITNAMPSPLIMPRKPPEWTRM